MGRARRSGVDAAAPGVGAPIGRVRRGAGAAGNGRHETALCILALLPPHTPSSRSPLAPERRASQPPSATPLSSPNRPALASSPRARLAATPHGSLHERARRRRRPRVSDASLSGVVVREGRRPNPRPAPHGQHQGSAPLPTAFPPLPRSYGQQGYDQQAYYGQQAYGQQPYGGQQQQQAYAPPPPPNPSADKPLAVQAWLEERKQEPLFDDLSTAGLDTWRKIHAAFPAAAAGGAWAGADRGSLQGFIDRVPAFGRPTVAMNLLAAASAGAAAGGADAHKVDTLKATLSSFAPPGAGDFLFEELRKKGYDTFTSLARAYGVTPAKGGAWADVGDAGVVLAQFVAEVPAFAAPLLAQECLAKAAQESAPPAYAPPQQPGGYGGQAPRPGYGAPSGYAPGGYPPPGYAPAPPGQYGGRPAGGAGGGMGSAALGVGAGALGGYMLGSALHSGGGYGHGGYGGGGHYGGAPGQETNVTNNYYGDAQGQGGSGFDMGNGGGGFAPDQQSGWADTGGGFDMGDAGGGGFDGGGDFGGGGGDW